MNIHSYSIFILIHPPRLIQMFNDRKLATKKSQSCLSDMDAAGEKGKYEEKNEKARKQKENRHKFLSSALDHPFTNKFTLLHHTGMVQALNVWLV